MDNFKKKKFRDINLPRTNLFSYESYILFKVFLASVAGYNRVNDEGLTHEMSALKLFTVANLRYELS